MTIIYITCKNKKEAQKIGLYLVRKRLAACCNIIPQINSLYWWKNKIVKAGEVILIAHTMKRNFKRIAKEIKKLHGYEVPCILEIPVEKVNREYLKWLQKETKI